MFALLIKSKMKLLLVTIAFATITDTSMIYAISATFTSTIFNP